MNPHVKGLVIAALHVGLVASLGGKLLYDRASLPKAWAQAVPYDPNLPIRGRYVSLQLTVAAKGVAEPKPSAGWQPPQAVSLRSEGGWLVADPIAEERTSNSTAAHLRFIQRPGGRLTVLEKPVPFFIPEHVKDPSRRAPDEELWVEVTIPKKGPPRPIRLGVKKGSGPIVPLQLG